MASLTDVWDGVGEQPTVVYKEPLVENIVSSSVITVQDRSSIADCADQPEAENFA